MTRPSDRCANCGAWLDYDRKHKCDPKRARRLELNRRAERDLQERNRSRTVGERIDDGFRMMGEEE